MLGAKQSRWFSCMAKNVVGFCLLRGPFSGHFDASPDHGRRRSFSAVAEALGFPGAVAQGSDLPGARLMIPSAIEDLAQALLEEGKPLPVPPDDAHSPDAHLVERVPLSVHAGTALP